MRKSFFTLFIVAAISAMLFSVSHVQAADPLKDSIADLGKGIKTQDQGLIDKSIKAFEGLVKNNEKDHMNHYWLAKAHYAMADYLDLKSPDGKDASGEGEKNIDATLEHAKHCLTAKEDFLDGYILKYLALSKKFSYVGFPKLMMYVGEINETLEKAEKLSPENTWVLVIKGMNLANGFPAPDPKEPIEQFEKAIKIDPKMDEAYYQIAVVQLKAKNTDEAKKYLKKALEINPSNHWAKKKLSGLEAKKEEKKA